MRRDILQIIHEQSPQRPACFDTHEQWVEWLASAHAGGMKVVRRVDTGKSRGNRETHFSVLPVGQQSHCKECSKRRQEQMQAEGRCFPVNVPAAAKPEQKPQRGQGPQLGRFEVSGIATIKGLRIRKVGKDDNRMLAIFLKLELAKIDAGVCAYFDDLLCAFLYRQEVGQRVVRNKALRPIAYTHQVRDASVEIDGATFHGADASDFVIVPIDGMSVSLSCSVCIYPGRANYLDLIGRVQDGVRIRISGPPDLFDDEDEEPAAKPQKQQALI